MNNKEYLIQILLKLRSIGIKNDKILGAIEKIPPHFYYNIFNPGKDNNKIDIVFGVAPGSGQDYLVLIEKFPAVGA